MTRFHPRRYDRPETDRRGDAPIPAPSDTTAPTDTRADDKSRLAGDPVEFDRLERAVVELMDRFESVRRENTRLAEALASRDRRVEELESRCRESNQRQRDVAKRIDDLLGQIDQIELHFAERGA